MKKTRTLLIAAALALFLPSLAAGIDVVTQHNDSGRTGQNLSETILTPSNVNVNLFGKLFARAVDGQIYAQPLYLSNLTIQGGTHNVVFVATMHNSVYAFDADDPGASTALWQVNLGTPVPSRDISSGYTDISPEIGILATPVIDTANGIIYVVAKTKNLSNSSYHFQLHALDVLTGQEKFSNSPVEITAQVSGTGAGSSGGQVSLSPLFHLNRPGLLLMNGVVYLAFGSLGDIPPYHGWVLGYNANSLQQVSVFNTTPNGSNGAIWQAGNGLMGDAAGNIYFMTGNGTFDANNTGGTEYGDSIVKLSTASGLTVADYFTPFNQASLNSADEDLGSGGPMALPGTNLLVGMGKDGVLRLVNTQNMGKFNSSTNNDVQEFQAYTGGLEYMTGPIYWNSPSNGPVVYLWGPGDVLKSFSFTGSLFQTTPVARGTVTEFAGSTNAVPLSLSANGSQAGTGIIWGPAAYNANSNPTTVPGIMHAFDATTLVELWNSRQNLARDDVGNYAKFTPSTVANGKVYVPTFSNQLVVYGLLGFSVTTSTLPTGVIGATYSQTLAASGGRAPYSWSITSGSLPAGLTLDPATGTISGTPTATGSSNFTVQARDANQATASKNLTLNIVTTLPTNIAPLAAVTASSQNTTTGQTAVKAVDGVIDGYPGDYTREWATTGQGVGAFLNLAWSAPYSVNQVVLYDRPNADDQITSATLAFSDGSSLVVGPLNNDGTATTYSFAARVITSLRMTVTGVSSTTGNVGLSEIQVNGTPASGTQYTLTTSVSPSGSGTVTANPSQASYPSGTQVVLTAAPNTGFTFSSWSGGASGTTNPLTVTMTGNLSLTANFTALPGTLTVTPATALSSSGAPGGPFTPSSAVYTLQNSGNSAITWSASNAQTWVTLSQNGGSLTPGATATVTVSINANAATLAAGSYSDTVSFTNVTNGSGNTTRGVTLTVTTVQSTNIAPLATVTASTQNTTTGQTAVKAVDGVIDGYPGDYTKEWATTGQRVGAFLNLAWSAPYSVSQLVLYDRPNTNDQITSATIAFSDGSNITVGPLNNNGTATTYAFPARVITGLRMTVTGVSASTNNVGLSEIQVSGVPASGNQYTLTTSVAPSGGGSVTANPNQTSYLAGAQVILTAVPNTGYSFGSWSGSASGTANPLTVTMTGNLSITANFTPLPGSLTVTPATALNATGAPGGPFTPSSMTYTLQNPGNSTITWSDSKSQPWVTLSSSGGSLTPGATTTITVSINTTAATLAVGTYSDTVSFTNTTNGNGNTTRAVNLTVTSAQPTNIAPLATVTASTQNTTTGQTAVKAVDGVIDGYPGDYTKEWATTGQRVGAFLNLAWSAPYSVSQVVLYDRPNTNDQITSATLAFSDGSSITVGPLNNNGTATPYSFPARVITGLRMTVTGVSASTANIGLSEIQVYGVPSP
jgi:uncharacterized repeat protein (TIGR02543 family)